MTLKEFADSYLPPPIRERFFYNIDRDIRRTIRDPKEIVKQVNRKLCLKLDEENARVGIMCAFWWDSTIEGSEYWSEIYSEIGVKYDIRRSR